MTDPSLGRLAVLERQTIFTPLGIRFWDVARDLAVTDGLLVTARAQDGPPGIATAYLTASGVYAFQGLPGLRAVEYPLGDASSVLSPPVSRRMVVEVNDRLQRFVPTVFKIDAPHRGIFPSAPPGSPPAGSAPGFYLFSAPTRRMAADLAVVRADLVDRNSEQPAAHAVLMVSTPDGRMMFGIADERGCVVVALPYPRFISPGGGSPPIGSPPIGSPPSGSGGRRWLLGLRVRYQPAALVTPPGASRPDISSIFGQPEGLIWSSPSTPIDQLPAELAYGQELIVRSSGESVLRIGPSASP